MEKTPYDSGKDCVFFKDKSNFWFKLSKGSFVIFFPEDAHAPLAGNSRVKKAVIKVRA
jgi:beta-galactosidase beta subunit